MLAGVDSRFAAGERVLLTGANGAGKTTLLRIMATSLRPSAGRVVWENEDDSRRERIRRSIGYVGHQALVYDELTARENLRFVAETYSLAAPASKSDHWLDRFGLARRADDRVATFSRGMRQRLALARAFVVEPRLLLLDEPAAALDDEGDATLQTALKGLGPEVCALVATHEPSAFAGWATRRLHLEGGRLGEVPRP